MNKCPNVLFMHNAVPEYRIAFWKELNKFVNLTILATRNGVENEIYGLDRDTADLNISYLNVNIVSEIMRELEKFDAVILPPADAFREWMVGLFVSLLCKRKGIRLIYWTERWEVSWGNYPVKKKIKNLIQRVVIGSLAISADFCVAAGSQSRKYLQRLHIKESKIRIVYDSSTSPEPARIINFEKEYGIAPTQKMVLYFGRLIKRKGIMVLLEAFEKLGNDEVVLMVCGTGNYEEQCKAYTLDHEMKNVIFTGKIQPGIRWNYYHRADVFILPSYAGQGVIEAWGLTVNEALEVGTPVIATTAVGSAFDLLAEGSGLIVKDDCVEELLAALRKMLGSSMDRNDIRSRYEKFSVKQMAKSFAEIIRASL